jgi:mannose-6-phosphate isomerase-like protein (cupin superfamily)
VPELELRLSPTESLVVRKATADLLEVEATYLPSDEKPPPHFHPAQDEHFEVLEGTLRVSTARQDGELKEGEQLDVPRGTVHRMWNPGPETVRTVWQTRPAGRTEEWFRSLDALQRSGQVDGKGRPRPLAFAPLAQEFRDTFRLAVGPRPVVDPLLAALAIVGRARGHSPRPAR